MPVAIPAGCDFLQRDPHLKERVAGLRQVPKSPDGVPAEVGELRASVGPLGVSPRVKDDDAQDMQRRHGDLDVDGYGATEEVVLQFGEPAEVVPGGDHVVGRVVERCQRARAGARQ